MAIFYLQEDVTGEIPRKNEFVKGLDGIEEKGCSGKLAPVSLEV